MERLVLQGTQLYPIISTTMNHDNQTSTNQLPIRNDDHINKMVTLIVEHYAPKRVYLFGSKARGDGGLDSDYDFLIVVDEKVSQKQREEFGRKRWDAGLFDATDIVIWTKHSFDEISQVKTSLPATVLEEGKLLYEVA